MKKKMLFFAAITILTVGGIVGIVKTTKAACPNGCVAGTTGCNCNGDYPQYAEAKWPATLQTR